MKVMKGGDPLNSRGPSYASSDRFEGGGLSAFTHECQSAFIKPQWYIKNERKKRGRGEEERERGWGIGKGRSLRRVGTEGVKMRCWGRGRSGSRTEVCCCSETQKVQAFMLK